MFSFYLNDPGDYIGIFVFAGVLFLVTMVILTARKHYKESENNPANKDRFEVGKCAIVLGEENWKNVPGSKQILELNGVERCFCKEVKWVEKHLVEVEPYSFTEEDGQVVCIPQFTCQVNVNPANTPSANTTTDNHQFAGSTGHQSSFNEDDAYSTLNSMYEDERSVS